MIKTLLSIFLLTAAMNGCGDKTPEVKPISSPAEPVEPSIAESDKVVLAYVTSWSSEIPDPTYLTHINYAFGQVRNAGGKWNGVSVDNPARLKKIVELKRTKPSLKVLLSIGGWGADGFSQMAANDTWQAEFAVDCKRVIDEFGLDGIDLDWESPTTTAQGAIAASSDDTDNFSKLSREIRAAIGTDKLLTIASGSSGEHYDWKAIDPYFDFYNIMTYDMGNPPDHHSALYKFGGGGWGWADRAVDLHIEKGVPAGKLTLGIPFYGRASKTLKPGGDNFTPWHEIIGLVSGGKYTEKWDDDAKVPYLVDGKGTMVCSYDNPRSIAIKCTYLKERGMLGAMYWDYGQDDGAGTLRKAVWNGVMVETTPTSNPTGL